MNGEFEKILNELEDLYHRAPCGYHSLDARGVFLKINDTELGWLGLSREKVVGQLSLPDIVFPEDRETAIKAFGKLLRDKAVRDLEIRLLRKDGNPFPVLVNANAILDEAGHFLMTRSVLTDISGMKKAEKALQTLLESEERYRSVIAAIADGIILLDLEGTITHCNPSAAHILGISCLDILGRAFSRIDGEFYRENGSKLPESELPPAIALATGKPCSNAVMGLKRKGMTWIKVSSEPLFYPESGQPFAILVSISDISEHKRQREELQHSYGTLRELSFRLEHAREAERTRIAREIHDELGSTLTSAKFDLSWAVEKYGERAQFEEVFKGLDAAIKSVKKICNALRPSILDDLGLFAAAEWQLGQFGRKTGIRCRIKKRGREPILPQDVATGIFRIFQETLTNIARHAEASNVSVAFRLNEKDILLTVTDDGKGIDMKQAAGAKSLGILGMSERAQALGGALSVSQAKPKGTRVALSIPLERRASDRPSAASIP